MSSCGVLWLLQRPSAARLRARGALAARQRLVAEGASEEDVVVAGEPVQALEDVGGKTHAQLKDGANAGQAKAKAKQLNAPKAKSGMA
mmetsp:Transcript_25102/g.83722  ORF Transcript_25102/g.83722 Transcript_25102/m.83722 type:complete len:88 (+) Transcript_25102:40-303(+)